MCRNVYICVHILLYLTYAVFLSRTQENMFACILFVFLCNSHLTEGENKV